MSVILTYSCGTALDFNQLPPLRPNFRATGHLNAIQLLIAVYQIVLFGQGRFNELLIEDKFNFVSNQFKDFITAFNSEMTLSACTFGGQIGKGWCWGKYMIVYTKAGVKSKKVFARIDIREESIVLRLFLNGIDLHREYLENAPDYIREVFTGEHARCQHCHHEKGEGCRFRKTYPLENWPIEKCIGFTYEFQDPNLHNLPDYLDLFHEFYPIRGDQEEVDFL